MNSTDTGNQNKVSPSNDLNWLQRRWQSLTQQWSTDEELDTLDWLEDADRALLEQEPLKARLLLYVALVAILSLIVWSAFAEVDQVTRGEGKVIPSKQIQVIQSLQSEINSSSDSIDFNWAQSGPEIGPNWVQFLSPIGPILVFTLAGAQCENKRVFVCLE